MMRYLFILFLALSHPILAVPTIYADAHTDVTGTWNGNGTITEVSTNSPYEGAHHYQFSYNYTGYWAGIGLNMDNWGTAAGLDFSGYTHIRLAYRGLSSGQTLQLQLRNAGNVYGNNLDVGGQAGAYTVVELSLTSLSLGTSLNLAAITEIDMSVTGTNANGSGTVYLDAIELVNGSSGGLPASPQTWARANALGKGINATNWLEAYWLIPLAPFPK